MSTNTGKIIGENGMLGIPQQLIPDILKRYDIDKPLPKKIHELLVGYIFTQFLEKKQKESAIIGFPATNGWHDHCTNGIPTLDWLLENENKFIKDTDVDIQISSGDLTTNLQITRFVYPKGQNANRSLANLIAKKCRQQKDNKLYLVVSIERTPNITGDELRNLLTSIEIPFGSVFLIFKASSERGHFSYCQLYPRPIIGKEIRVPLPV